MRSAGIAAIACCAVITDTSCSTERLPKKTPTCDCDQPCAPPGCERSEDDDLALEVDVERAAHGIVSDLDKGEHVGRSRVVDVDDEVGVLRGDLRATDAVPFQSGRLDEPAGLVVGRVLEDTPEAANAVRLRRFPLAPGSHPCARERAPASSATHAQPRTHHDVIVQVVLETRVAVREPAFDDVEA